jgi:acetylornithine deacetylase
LSALARPADEGLYRETQHEALADAIALLGELVAFDTESDKSNLALIERVEAHLTDHGVRFVRVPNASGDKAAVYATVGPMVDGGVVLSGHTDVVPVAGQAWSSDPFVMREEAGRLYGRGTADMKGFGACALVMLPRLARLPLKRPVHLLLSYDEETTCLGVVDTIARFGASLPRPAAAIVGEPTRMRVADAHKSVVTFRTRVTGRESHSSTPALGANAVWAAAALIVELDRIGEDLKARGDPTGRFDPPHSTVHVGTVAGGTARNIVPLRASLHWEFRGIPGLALEEVPDRLAAFAAAHVLPRLRAAAPEAEVVTEREVAVPGLDPDPGSVAEALALRLAGSNRTTTVSFATEGGHFQRAGVPTVVCGPGDIAQAHKPDEYVEVAELARCLGFLERLGAELSA